MAFAGYMKETDTERIWNLGDFDVGRFSMINVRIGEVINFLVYGDATHEITDIAVKPIVEQISEEIFVDLVLAAKANKHEEPWDFIQANVSKMDWKFYDNYLLKKVRIKLGKQYIVKYSNKLSLPSHSD